MSTHGIPSYAPEPGATEAARSTVAALYAAETSAHRLGIEVATAAGVRLALLRGRSQQLQD